MTKRVIDGKVYNTETAECIAEYERGERSNFHFVYEALYRTPKGRYFLEYSGGPLSVYAENHGPHLVSGSSGIRVVEPDEALQWCERYQVDVEIIGKYFTLEEG